MTDRSADARSASYAALLSALAGTRRDPATARFDEELAAAEAAGSIDPVVARTLRWWQRESVRAVEEHLQSVLPGLIAGLETAEHEAVESVATSAESWVVASGGAVGRPLPPPPPDDPGPVRPVPSGDPTGPAPGSAHGDGGATTTPHLRPVDRGPDGPGGSGAPHVLRPGFAPPDAAGPGPAGPVAQTSADGGAPPRRLLVAGLTVLTDDDAPRATSPAATPAPPLHPHGDALGTPR